jgi:hypothetical protein
MSNSIFFVDNDDISDCYFFGGETRYIPQTGAEYTLDSRCTLGGNESTTFEEVKIIIF